MKEEDKKRDLSERLLKFAIDVIKFIKTIKRSRESDVVVYQLTKASTSIGANYEEAQGAFSKEDFGYRVSVCYKEARESHYWLRIIKGAELSRGQQLDNLVQESFEIKNIFASMHKKTHFREDI
jgi:four helix bundle protein